MNATQVAEKFIEVHREYDGENPSPIAVSITPQTKPLADIEGFDSDFIPEIVRRVARELGYPLRKGVRVSNIYVEDGKKLGIQAIASKFLEKYIPKMVRS